jgi:uncharacterized OB-fold protein
MQGIVITETVVHAAPENLASQAPYQIAIVRLDDGRQLTVRVDGARVAIDTLVGVEAGPDGLFRARALDSV